MSRLLVPELAPSLGRLIVPRRRAEPFFPLDDIRERLATRVLELGGAARVAAAQEERAAVFAALSRNAWVDAWEQAVRQAADRVAEGMDRAIEHAARQARMPARRWRRLLVTPGERRAMAARLATGGGPLLDALEVLDAVAVVDAESHAAWQDALRTVARRLEAAWLALEEAAAAERERWAPELAEVVAWRPPLWPVVVLWVPLAAALLWLGLILGRFVPAPAWLAERLGL